MLMERIELKYCWNDLVLADNNVRQLYKICEAVRRRKEVASTHRSAKKRSGRGVSALFSGPPGTGKKMAAAIIARELSLDLYRIDLSQVVNKYIGETEKNLKKVFDAADVEDVILFFDEADELFGRRSEVNDARDRYANKEIEYLLDRMEAFEGLVVLSSSQKRDIDDAFLRRLCFVVEFPFPDDRHRRRIWESVLPHEAPVGKDVDFSGLAKLRLSGENIAKIAYLATSSAAKDNDPVVTMEHILWAAQYEYEINGWPWQWPPSRTAAGSSSPSPPAISGDGPRHSS